MTVSRLDSPCSAAAAAMALNDQHTYVDSFEGDIALQVGDLVGFGPSHPYTTFDKWPLLYAVDDRYGVVDGIRTFF